MMMFKPLSFWALKGDLVPDSMMGMSVGEDSPFLSGTRLCGETDSGVRINDICVRTVVVVLDLVERLPVSD